MLPQTHNYAAIAPLFAGLEFNLIIAASFAGTAPIEAYVDDPAKPTSAFIHTTEGAYLGGRADNATFNAGFQQLLHERYLDEDYIVLEFADPAWEKVLNDIFDQKVFKYPRYHYHFQPAPLAPCPVPDGYQLEQVSPEFIQRSNLKNMEAVQGAITSNWLSEADFFQRGFGMCLVNGETIVSWCMADCAYGHTTEIGIHTDRAYQKRGMATITVAATLEAALQRGYTEIGWHCWVHNIASWKLAEKVGLTRQREYYAYLCMATDALYCVECGVAQIRQDNLVDALYWYEKSMGYDPDFALPYFLAGSARAKLDEYPQALEMLHAAVARGWTHADTILYGEEFKPLHGMTEWERLISRIM